MSTSERDKPIAAQSVFTSESAISQVKMTLKQERFVKEFLLDLNGTQAAIRAGYSEKTARSIAQENLTKPDIVCAIQKAQAERSVTLQITSHGVLAQLMEIAQASIADVVEWRENQLDVKPSNALNQSTLRAIHSITIRGGESGPPTISVRMHDKLRALELCGKHLGIFNKDAHAGPPEYVDALRNALQALDHEAGKKHGC